MSGMCLDDGKIFKKVARVACNFQKMVYSMCVVRMRFSHQPHNKGDCQMKMYDLIPNNGRKSFYGKAKVEVSDDGREVLYSYNTPILEKASDGTLKRLYFAEPSVTTCAHIRSFCGLDKKGFLKLA